jgi:hypothetical protein
MSAMETGTDLIHQLPRDVHHILMHTLRATLPTVGDTPEDLARRDRDALARIACLMPANADEADLAAKYVAAGAQAMECIRLARLHGDDTPLVLRCTAQASSMLRQARALRVLLMRVQDHRRKREADVGAPDSSTWTGPVAAAPAAPPPAAPVADVAAEADRYALAHRKRATLIRSLGRLPDNLHVGLMAPALVRAIVTGNSPVLRSLDKRARQPERMAA